jgi:dihydrofolate reductase
MIAAISENRVLGKDNKLPWNVPDDTKHFREITSGHTVIMGRKTYQSIGHALPNRTNIVITRDPSFTAPDAIVAHSIEEALDEAKKHETSEIFIIGGGEIYNLGMKYADKLYLTIIDGTFEGDAFFPEYKDQFPVIVSEQEGESGGHHYTFLDLVRNTSSS